MIKSSEVETALAVFSELMEIKATAVAFCKYLEHKRKIVRSHAFRDADGSTVAANEAIAFTSPEYAEVIEEIRAAEYDRDLCFTKLKQAELTIDVWRSENSTRNKGHL